MGLAPLAWRTPLYLCRCFQSQQFKSRLLLLDGWLAQVRPDKERATDIGTKSIAFLFLAFHANLGGKCHRHFKPSRCTPSRLRFSSRPTLSCWARFNCQR